MSKEDPGWGGQRGARWTEDQHERMSLAAKRRAWGWAKGEEERGLSDLGPSFHSGCTRSRPGQAAALARALMHPWQPELTLPTLCPESLGCPTCGRCCLSVQRACKFDSFWGGWPPGVPSGG